MFLIPFKANLYEQAKANNIISGIIIFDLITFLAYILNPVSIIYPGDIDMIFGAIVGLTFSLKNRKINQKSINIGLLVGILGAILSAFSFTIFRLVLELIIFGSILISFFIFYLSNLILALVIGSIFGGLIGYYYSKKNEEIKSRSSIDDDFFEDLIEK